MTAQQRPIPAFYRHFFTIADPAMAVWGAYMTVAYPDTVLDSFVPRALSRRDPAQFMLFQQLAGWPLGTAFLSIFLLRYTRDVGVWKIFQASVLIVDVVLGYALWDALGRQERLSLGALRAEDWGCIGITAVFGLMRSAFLLGVGMGGGGRVKGKRA